MVRRSACPVFFVLPVIFLMASHMDAADKPDFSGSYTLTRSKGAFTLKKSNSWTLQVVQTGSAIEITRVMDGKQNANRFQLDGAEGAYNSPGGLRGTCTARFKGKSLIVDTFVTAHSQPNSRNLQIHTRERWELSSDTKTLTIRSDVDSPGSPLGGFQVIDPWSEIYTRN